MKIGFILQIYSLKYSLHRFLQSMVYILPFCMHLICQENKDKNKQNSKELYGEISGKLSMLIKMIDTQTSILCAMLKYLVDGNLNSEIRNLSKTLSTWGKKNIKHNKRSAETSLDVGN